MELSVKKHRIQSLNGLKALAMLGIFWQHCGITKLPFDTGARICEFLFLASGFLVAYNYIDKEVPATWSESLRYLCQKLIRMWPLHLITFLIVFLFRTPNPLSKTNLLTAALNLSLLQAWSPDGKVFFSYNGASWFLSALLFCYFMTPALLRFSRRTVHSTLYFVIIAAIRLLLEWVPLHTSVRFWQLNTHVSPVIRCLEFFMGMLLVPLFFQVQQAIEHAKGKRKSAPLLFKIGFTVTEILTVIGTTYLLLKKDKVWIRGEFVLLFCIPLFLFAFDSGAVSKLLSLKVVRVISTVQLEFYLFHQALIHLLLYRPLLTYIPNEYVAKAVMFGIVLLSAWLYHWFLQKPLSELLRKILQKTFSVLQIQISV